MSLKNRVLAGGLVLQAVILIIVFWPSSSSLSVEKLLPGLEEAQVTGVTITDFAGKSIRLRGGPWGCVLPEAGDYPCQKDKLTSLTNRLVGIDTGSLVTQTAGSHRRLKVAGDEFEQMVEIHLADGGARRIYLGTSPRPGSVHVRVEDRDEVYLASAISDSDASAQATDWVEPVYFSVPQEQVVSLTQENAQGRLRLEKDDSGVWTLPEESPVRPLDQTKVQSLVRKAASLRMVRPLGTEALASYGLQNPGAVVTLRTLDGDGNSGEYILLIGAEDGQEERYVVKSSESLYYVLVADSSVSDLVEKGSGDLLEPPPTATPEPQA